MPHVQASKSTSMNSSLKQTFRRFIWFALIAGLSAITISFLESSSIFTTPLSDFTDQKKIYVTRGEFAKLLFNLKELPKPKTKKCFRDIRPLAKNAEAICALQKHSLLTGIIEEKFKEKTNLRMEEFVRILCRAEAWIGENKETTFTACLKEARKLDLFSSARVSSKALVKRKQVAEILEKLYAENGEKAAAEETDETHEIATREKVEEIITPFTPVAPNLVSKTFFSGMIELDRDFPNVFYKHEIHRFKGRLTSGNFEQAFVFLIPEQELTNGGDTINYLNNVKSDGTFDIPVIFRRPGNYQLGIIAGESGKSKVTDISVLEKLPDPGTAQTAPSAQTNIAFAYTNGETKFSWPLSASTDVFTKLTFQQNKQTISYFSRTFVREITPDILDFKNFSEGEAAVTLEVANGSNSTALQIFSPWTRAASLKASLVTRPVRTFNSTIRCPKFMEVFESPQKFTLDCVADVAVAMEGAYTKPDGNVETFELSKNGNGEKKLAAGTKLKAEITLQQGINVLEVNDPDGSALINAPLFVGKNLAPLIPDFLSRNQALIHSTPLDEVYAAREELLAFVNAARKKGGRKTIKLDENLIPFSQAHCDDMSKRNFFSHYNPENEGPDDRRKKSSVDTLVKENLAKAPSIEFGHEGLMASPAHRKTILEEKWTRVGIGVTKNREGLLLICEEFSTDPLNENDLVRLESEFLEKANEIRNSKGLSALAVNEILKTKAKEWSQKMAAEKFFGFKNTAGDSLITVVRDAGIRVSIQSHLVEGNDLAQVEKEFLAQPFDEARFHSVGIGFAKDNVGILKVSVIYSE